MRVDCIKLKFGFRLKLPANLIVAVTGFFLLTACEQTPPSSSHSNYIKDSDSELSSNFVVSLNLVTRFFPELSQEVGTGLNATAVGKPKASRSVIYANGDDSKKLTISVDQYESVNAASSAYQEAFQKSQIPGFKLLAKPNIGQQAFVGSVTQGDETHVGLGMLEGNLIIGLTLSGYYATQDNITKLIDLGQVEDIIAKLALDQRILIQK
jgi:hypothetical protein